MITLKKYQAPRIVIILGISVATLLLLIGLTIIHAFGFSPFTKTAHAATSITTTCATTKGIQPTLCEQQDPITQGCVTDAETLNIQTVFQDSQQTKPLGEVELRYSPTCQSYWVRTTAFITAKGVFKTIHAMIVFHNHTKEDIVETPTFPDPRFAYIAWTDMTTAPLSPKTASGSFNIIGQSQPLTITL